LWVVLYRIVEESIEGRKQFRSQSGEAGLANEFANQVGGLGDDEIVAIPERFADGNDTGFFLDVAERVEGRYLLFEGTLAGHVKSVNE